METIDRMLDALEVTVNDVLADYGSGPAARIVIRAVERFQCFAVGVEIDPVAAEKSRAAIYAAEVAGTIPPNRIRIITMDAAEFDHRVFGITVATCYLFPKDATKLVTAGVFTGLDRLAAPLHPLPGLKMRAVNDVWLRASTSGWCLFRDDELPPVATAPPTPKKAPKRERAIFKYFATYCQPCKAWDLREGPKLTCKVYPIDCSVRGQDGVDSVPRIRMMERVDGGPWSNVRNKNGSVMEWGSNVTAATLNRIALE